MKIAIGAQGPDLDAEVGPRFGTCRYFLILDSDTGAFGAVANPGASRADHAGVQAVIMIISQKVDVLVTGYLSPTAQKHLTDNGVKVVSGVKGQVAEVLEHRRENWFPDAALIEYNHRKFSRLRDEINLAGRRALMQFGSVIPIMVAVVMLMGLFRAFVGKELAAAFFSADGWGAALGGACAGSLFAGNPVTSYIIAGEFLEQGVSLLAATAFMVTWVSVGLIQLPAEIDALGKRFALVRNALAFISSIAIATLTVDACHLLRG
jgi:predicted Fe-Mo cluster-binding NifX family protein